jgi:SNF2 family DNA or RNA helicase
MAETGWWSRSALPARRRLLLARLRPPDPPRHLSEPPIAADPARVRPVDWPSAEPGLHVYDRPDPAPQPALVVDIRTLLERAMQRSRWQSERMPGEPLAETPRERGEAESNTIEDRLCTLLLVPLDLLLPSPDSVLEWPSPLMPFQLAGVRHLLEAGRVLLADDMGLGKTIQAIAAMRLLIVRRAIEECLVVVPASLIDQWRGELERWAPELRVVPVRGPAADRRWQWRAAAHVTLVSYETFRSDFATGAAERLRQTWDLVILDEAQKIKNRESDISLHVKRLSRLRSWALTGTPLENSLEDLASIMEFVDHRDDGEPRVYSVSAALLERHRALQIRRRKAEVLADLPPKQVISLELPLLPRQRAAYERAEREGIVQLRERGSAVRIEHILELITRLKQLCNVDPVSGESAKLEDIRERLETLTAEGHRALVFSQFADERFGVMAAARFLEAFDPLTFTGALSSRDRDAVIRQFRRDDRHRALVLSLRAGGVGLNLQEASYVFHLDRWWNPAIERQAEDRSHRMGQTYPVTVIKYTCLGTIEERIAGLLAAKQRLFDEVVDDVSVDLATRLSQDELFGLFGLERGGGGNRQGAKGDRH